MLQRNKAASVAVNWLFSRPFYASLDVTNYCNLRCEGCDFPLLLEQGKLGEDGSLEGLEARLEALHEAFGSLVVALAGFEPTIRKDLPEIIQAASKHNYAGIVTNGTLITEEKARNYWNAGLLFASVSMPAFDDEKLAGIIGTGKYGIERIKNAVELFAATVQKGMPPRYVTITATIDDSSTPRQLREMTAYASGAGVKISFQPYASSKPASASPDYDRSEDKRAISERTLEDVFGGSIAERLIEIKREFPGVVIGRKSALRKFDVFVREGRIAFKPRALKVYANGDVALHPEAQVFSNLDVNTPEKVWKDYRAHVESLRQTTGFFAPNAYRCVNLTTPSTPIGDAVGKWTRAIWN